MKNVGKKALSASKWLLIILAAIVYIPAMIIIAWIYEGGGHISVFSSTIIFFLFGPLIVLSIATVIVIIKKYSRRKNIENEKQSEN